MSIKILTEDQAVEIAVRAATIAIKNMLEVKQLADEQNKSTLKQEEPLLTVEDIAIKTGLNNYKITRMANQKFLPHHSLPGAGSKRMFFKLSEVEEVLSQTDWYKTNSNVYTGKGNTLSKEVQQIIEPDYKSAVKEIEPLHTVDDIAKHTGMHPGTIRRMASEGTLPHYRAGKKLLFKISEVEAALSRTNGSKQKKR